MKAGSNLYEKPSKSIKNHDIHQNVIKFSLNAPTMTWKVFFRSLIFFYFFSELRNNFGYSFDAKLPELSIYDVFRAIPALLRGF